MSEIYFIRHGQATYDGKNYDHLSELGREQARVLGDYLSCRGVRFNAAYSGTLTRQRHTAELVLSGLGQDPAMLQLAPEGNEYNSMAIMDSLLPHLPGPGPRNLAEMRALASDRPAFRQAYERGMLHWLTAPVGQAGPETWRGFQERVQGFVRRVMEEQGRGRRVAVFSSGGPISAVMRMALSLEDEVALRLTWQIRNSSVSVFKYDQHRLTLHSFNSVSHLETCDRPGLITLV